MKKRHSICMKRKLQIATFLMFAGFVGATLLPRLFVTNANTGAPSDEQSPVNPEAVINQGSDEVKHILTSAKLLTCKG